MSLYRRHAPPWRTVNVDFSSFTENLVSGGKRKEYALTLDMGKKLGMVERTAKGKEVRQYFIEGERRAMSALPDFSNPAIAAMTWQISGVHRCLDHSQTGNFPV